MPGRVAWQFNGYSWAVNPESDSGWVYEHVEAENLPINAGRSSFQYGGTKSGRRQISGWLYGPSALDQYNRMKSWHRNRTTATLVDHLGNVSTARFSRFDAKPVVSATEWRQGRSTWQYTAELVEEG
jgi:hypothetical protein